MRRNPIKKARNEADRKYQEVGMNGGGLCEVCVKKQAYCVHHIIAKSLSSRLRYEIRNCIKVCIGCHNRIHSTADPAIFSRIEQVKGKRIMNWLEKVRREEVRTNLVYYKEILLKLNKILKQKKVKKCQVKKEVLF